MLMGGMYVVGVYLWASESSFKATSPSIISQVFSLLTGWRKLYSLLSFIYAKFAFFF